MHVVPVRHTADPARMRRFLEALGLTTTLVSDSGTWTALTAAGGGMGLHGAAEAEPPRAPGTTDLSFESDEPLEPVAARLTAAGFSPAIVDEAFGRSLRVLDPDGVEIQVNEAMTDLHGYTRLAGSER